MALEGVAGDLGFPSAYVALGATCFSPVFRPQRKWWWLLVISVGRAYFAWASIFCATVLGTSRRR